MKAALAVLFIIVLAVLACGCTVSPSDKPAVTKSSVLNATAPDLTGVWKGTSVGYIVKEGFQSYSNTVFNITEQKGQVFIGKKEYQTKDGKIWYEDFTGLVTADGEFLQTDSDKGFSLGKLTGPDTLELRYLEEGNNTKALISYLTRQHG